MNIQSIINIIKSYLFKNAQGYNLMKTQNKVYEVETLDLNKLHIALSTSYCQKLLGELQLELEQKYLMLKEQEKETKLHSTKHTEIVNKMHLVTEDLKTVMHKKTILAQEATELHNYIRNHFKLKFNK